MTEQEKIDLIKKEEEAYEEHLSFCMEGIELFNTLNMCETHKCKKAIIKNNNEDIRICPLCIEDLEKLYLLIPEGKNILNNLHTKFHERGHDIFV